MGYCQVTDIQADFKSITFTSSSNVTISAVTQFIVEASALIDSYVGSRYVTPITGTSSLALMSLYCRTLVSNRIQGIIATKQATGVDANQNAKAPGLTTSDVMKALKDLMNGLSVLSDATLLNANASFYSNNQQNGVYPHFRKNGRQW